jgi:hypothetical protein
VLWSARSPHISPRAMLHIHRYNIQSCNGRTTHHYNNTPECSHVPPAGAQPRRPRALTRRPRLAARAAPGLPGRPRSRRGVHAAGRHRWGLGWDGQGLAPLRAQVCEACGHTRKRRVASLAPWDHQACASWSRTAPPTPCSRRFALALAPSQWWTCCWRRARVSTRGTQGAASAAPGPTTGLSLQRVN